MKPSFMFVSAWLLVYGMASLLVADTVGSPDMVGFALAGVGQTAPAVNNTYPDFVVKGYANFSYLMFGGNYSSANWTAWTTQTYYLKFKYATTADGEWLGFAVGAAGDVTGDGETHRDVLIGDIRYLDICDPGDAYGKAWLV